MKEREKMRGSGKRCDRCLPFIRCRKTKIGSDLVVYNVGGQAYDLIICLFMSPPPFFCINISLTCNGAFLFLVCSQVKLSAIVGNNSSVNKHLFSSKLNVIAVAIFS